MNKSDILSGFNNHIIDFFNDVMKVFPNDTDIAVAHTSLLTIKKMNPRLIVTIWKAHILDPYKDQIEAGDINFFLDRDYKQDLEKVENSGTILDKINTLREPIRQMGDDNKEKTIKYIQNLTKLCGLYHQ